MHFRLKSTCTKRRTQPCVAPHAPPSPATLRLMRRAPQARLSVSLSADTESALDPEVRFPPQTSTDPPAPHPIMHARPSVGRGTRVTVLNVYTVRRTTRWCSGRTVPGCIRSAPLATPHTAQMMKAARWAVAAALAASAQGVLARSGLPRSWRNPLRWRYRRCLAPCSCASARVDFVP